MFLFGFEHFLSIKAAFFPVCSLPPPTLGRNCYQKSSPKIYSQKIFSFCCCSCSCCWNVDCYNLLQWFWFVAFVVVVATLVILCLYLCCISSNYGLPIVCLFIYLSLKFDSESVCVCLFVCASVMLSICCWT